MIYSTLPDEPDFLTLPPYSKLAWYTLRMKLGPSGIGVMYASSLAERMGVTIHELTEAERVLVAERWLIRQANVYWLRNALRYDPSYSLKNVNHRISLERYLQGLPKLAIVNAFATYYDLALPFPELDDEQESEDLFGVKSKPLAKRQRKAAKLDELKEFRDEAAGLIQKHLWLGKKPPPNVKRCTMATELSVWTALTKRASPEDVNAAIPFIRKAIGIPEGESISLRIVNVRNEGQRLSVAIALAHKAASKGKGKKGGMDSLRDVLDAATRGEVEDGI